MQDFKFEHMQGSGSTGLDAFFENEPQTISPFGSIKQASAKPQRIRIATMVDIAGFQRISNETLIHKSTQDLWAIKHEGSEYFIERLFQDGATPIKG